MSRRRTSARSGQPVQSTAPLLLLVDSEPANLTELYDDFVRYDYQVLVSDSSYDALEQVRQYQPHLMIVGSTLADVSGNDMCRQIKADDRLGFIPIILFDGDAASLSGDSPWYADVVLPRSASLSDLHDWVNFLLHIRGQFDRLKRENERLLDAARSIEMLKRQIIANVSHELGTPLVQVKAAVALLAEESRQSENPGQPSVAEMAQQAVARLEGVVETIRQLAQTHDVRLVAVNVADSVDLALRHLERSWSSRNSTDRINVQIDPRLSPVRADKRALARLLQLLLDNALKFSESPSPVHLIARAEPRGKVWIGVRDFGIGIPPHEHHRVFDAFYQVDGSSTRRYGGTGSGLALAGLLARSMNTTIHLESTPGHGSTFYFVLPVATPEDYE